MLFEQECEVSIVPTSARASPPVPQDIEEAHHQAFSEEKLSVGCVSPPSSRQKGRRPMRVGDLTEFDRCPGEFEECKKWCLTPESLSVRGSAWEKRECLGSDRVGRKVDMSRRKRN